MEPCWRRPYSVYDKTASLVLNADSLFAPNASQYIQEYFKKFQTGLPAKLSFIVLATFSPTMGGSVIIVNAVYAGSQAESAKYLYPLFGASPLKHNLSMIPWSTINSVPFFGNEPANYTCPTGSTHNVYGSAVHRVDMDTFQVFYENDERLSSSMPKTNDSPLNYPDEAYKACRNSLLDFAYNATNRPLDRSINDFAYFKRKNL
ncbi:MAG: hypothetical protein Q9192_005558 [Flavoplaca navasiana]